MNYVGEGYVWNGASAGSQWSKNKVQHSRYGLVLRNSGVMGDQGMSGHPTGDIFGKYVSTDITDAQTLSDNSNPGLAGFTSKLYSLVSTCSGTTTYLPCQNNGANPYSSATTFSTTGSLPCICTGDCGSGRMSSNSSIYADSATIVRDSVLLSILSGIENGDPFPIYDIQTRWALQYYVSSQNSNFNAANGYENAKDFAMVDGAISGNNYTQAQSLLSSINVNNIIENNWQTVDNIIIKLQRDSLDSSNINTLSKVAIQCPLTGGSIIYNARAILNHYYKRIIDYSDNCNDNNDARLTSIIKTVTNTSAINVYPNPNNGNMFFTYKITKDAHLEISDIKGSLVGTYILPATTNNFEVKNENLKDGIYFYKVIDDKGTVVKIGKIIVVQ